MKSFITLTILLLLGSCSHNRPTSNKPRPGRAIASAAPAFKLLLELLGKDADQLLKAVYSMKKSQVFAGLEIVVPDGISATRLGALFDSLDGTTQAIINRRLQRTLRNGSFDEFFHGTDGAIRKANNIARSESVLMRIMEIMPDRELARFAAMAKSEINAAGATLSQLVGSINSKQLLKVKGMPENVFRTVDSAKTLFAGKTNAFFQKIVDLGIAEQLELAFKGLPAEANLTKVEIKLTPQIPEGVSQAFAAIKGKIADPKSGWAASFRAVTGKLTGELTDADIILALNNNLDQLKLLPGGEALDNFVRNYRQVRKQEKAAASFLKYAEWVYNSKYRPPITWDQLRKRDIEAAMRQIRGYSEMATNKDNTQIWLGIKQYRRIVGSVAKDASDLGPYLKKLGEVGLDIGLWDSKANRLIPLLDLSLTAGNKSSNVLAKTLEDLIEEFGDAIALAKENGREDVIPYIQELLTREIVLARKTGGLGQFAGAKCSQKLTPDAMKSMMSIQDELIAAGDDIHRLADDFTDLAKQSWIKMRFGKPLSELTPELANFAKTEAEDWISFMCVTASQTCGGVLRIACPTKQADKIKRVR